MQFGIDVHLCFSTTLKSKDATAAFYQTWLACIHTYSKFILFIINTVTAWIHVCFMWFWVWKKSKKKLWFVTFYTRRYKVKLIRINSRAIKFFTEQKERLFVPINALICGLIIFLCLRCWSHQLFAQLEDNRPSFPGWSRVCFQRPPARHESQESKEQV